MSTRRPMSRDTPLTVPVEWRATTAPSPSPCRSRQPYEGRQAKLTRGGVVDPDDAVGHGHAARRHQGHRGLNDDTPRRNADFYERALGRALVQVRGEIHVALCDDVNPARRSQETNVLREGNQRCFTSGEVETLDTHRVLYPEVAAVVRDRRALQETTEAELGHCSSAYRDSDQVPG